MEEQAWLFRSSKCGSGSHGEVVRGLEVRTAEKVLQVCRPIAVKRVRLEDGFWDSKMACCIRESVISRHIAAHPEMHNLMSCAGPFDGCFRASGGGGGSQSSGRRRFEGFDWLHSMPLAACSLQQMLSALGKTSRMGLRGMDAGFLMHSCMQGLLQFDALFPHLGHFDIKPANFVVMRDDGQIKLADFGHARTMGMRTVKDACTFYYRPPEVCLEIDRELIPHMPCKSSTRKADIWSLGMVFVSILRLWNSFELCPITRSSDSEECDPNFRWVGACCRMTGHRSLAAAWPEAAEVVRKRSRSLAPLVDRLVPLSLPARIVEAGPFVEPEVNEALGHLLQGMLAVDPAKRFSLAQVAAHPFWAIAPVDRMTPRLLGFVRELAGPVPELPALSDADAEACELTISTPPPATGMRRVDARDSVHTLLRKPDTTILFTSAFLTLQILQDPNPTLVQFFSALEIASALTQKSFGANNYHGIRLYLPVQADILAQIEADMRRINLPDILERLHNYYTLATSIDDLFAGLGIASFEVNDSIVRRVKSDGFSF